MRDLLFLLVLFVVTVGVALAVGPLFAILFLLVAKGVAIIWTSAAESYRVTLHEKRKRRHIRTIDGEMLEIAPADDHADEVMIETGKYHA
ncbi:MAG: hypothetical protein K8J31_12805 [Anaerolineae bacterium]|nr:hypothetical protein [Anaerolineae bacterium]